MTHDEQRKRREAVVAEVRAGRKQLAVARQYKLSKGTVSLFCRQAGLTSTTAGGRFNSYAVIADLCNTDLKLVEVATKHRRDIKGISDLYRKCVKHGIPVRRRKRGRPFTRDET